MDLNRLTKGEKIIGVSALLLLVLSFLPLWAELEFDTGGIDIPGLDADQRYSAWSAAFGFLLKLGLVMAILALALVVVRAVGATPDLPVPAWQIYAVTCGVALLLLLITVLTGPVGEQGSFGGVEWSRGLAVFLAPLLGAAMAYGAWLQMQEEGSAPASTGPPPSGPPPPAS